MDHQVAQRNRFLVDQYRAQLPKMGEVPVIRMGFGGDPEIETAAAQYAEVHCVDFTAEACAAVARYAEIHKNVIAHSARAPDLQKFPIGSIYSVAASRTLLQAHPAWTSDCMRASARVLAEGGFLQMQISSSHATLLEVIELTHRFQLQTLLFEGPDRTGFYHGLWRRMGMNWREGLPTLASITTVRIRKITNALRAVPVVLCRRRDINIAIYVHGLPEEVDLFDLTVNLGDLRAKVTAIGPSDSKGIRQIIAQLPELECTGLLPVELQWMGERMGLPGVLRVVPPQPEVPRLLSVEPSGNGATTAMVEDLTNPENFDAQVNGKPAWGYEYHAVEGELRRFQIRFQVPDGVEDGECNVTVRLGRRELPPMLMQVAASAEPYVNSLA